MATCLLRLTVHDPEIVAALDALRPARKQSAFIVAALRHFLRTGEGKAQLDAFLGTNSPKKEARSPVAQEPASPVPPSRSGPSKTNLDDIFK